MKDNIALIGFMGAGKTTIGKILAKYLDMKFVDTDKKIASVEKMSINEIFKTHGEQYFRDLERETILAESQGNNTIISTGGGVIIDNENIKNLRKTSFVVYLDCDIDCIYKRIRNSKTRPLLKNAPDLYEKITTLYNSRKLLYNISCDYSVKINEESNMHDTAQKIKEAYIRS